MQHLQLSEKCLPQQTHCAKGGDPQVDYMVTTE